MASRKSTVTVVVVLSGMSMVLLLMKLLPVGSEKNGPVVAGAAMAPVKSKRRDTTFGGPIGMFVTMTRLPPDAVQKFGTAGQVMNPWRVMKATESPRSPAVMFPAAVAVPPQESLEQDRRPG